MQEAPEKQKHNTNAATVPNHFDADDRPAIEALNRAHFIAFGPYAFWAATVLRDWGVLDHVNAAKEGVTLEALAAAVGRPEASLRVLLEAGLGIGLLYIEGQQYHLSKTGHFYLCDPTVRTNTDFMRDVLAPAAHFLPEAVAEARPAGLSYFGPWKTLFEGFEALPAPVRKTWTSFNNYHSSHAVRATLPVLFAKPPARLLDLGGGDGHFALACLAYNSTVYLGVADLPRHTAAPASEVQQAVEHGRLSLYTLDILDESEALPEGYDAIWMSQFLDNFSESQIVTILRRCAAALPPKGRIFIAETFWDRQRYEAAAFALQMTSLYFMNMVNGISQMWHSDAFKRLIDRAGLRIAEQHDGLGLTHTVLVLVKG